MKLSRSRIVSLSSLLSTSLFVLLLSLFQLSSYGQEVPALEWAKSMGGPQGDFAQDIAIDASGNVYSTGVFYATADFDPGPAVFNLSTPGGDHNVFVSKLDANGNFVWAKSMGGSNTDWGYAIAVDAGGNVFTTGYFSGTADFDPGPGVFNLTSSGGNADAFISKLDTDGDFVWAIKVGSTFLEYGHSITVDGSGNIYATGFFRGVVDFDPGAAVFNLTSSIGTANNTFILKLDTDSNFIWAKGFSGSLSNYGAAIFVDNTFNAYAVGYHSGITDFDPGAGVFNLTASGIDDAYITKLDASGNFVWARSMGGTANTRLAEITVDAGGSIYATGFFVGTTDLDPGAGIDNHTAVGTTDIFISKLDASGNFVWGKAMGSVNNDYGLGIATDAGGNVYTSGYFHNTVDFDPGAGVLNLTSAGSYDIFLSKLDPSGNLIWAVRTGANTTSYDVGKSITIDPAGTIYMAGGFGGTVDFDYSACVTSLTSAGQDDIYVQKITLGTVASPPSITSFTPTTGPIGTLVTITGTNFSSTPANNTVSFFNNMAATVTASDATSITTSVPTGTTTGKISVTVNCITVQSATNFTVGAAPLPTITSFTPTSGPIGTTVTISGTNFNATPANNVVQFNGTTSTVTASTTTSITTTVPTGATTGKITVTVGGNTATSAADFTVTAPSLPTITSFSPTSGPISTGVIITGTNFSTTPANNSVKFNGTSAVVTASTATNITTSVPAGTTTGKITVTVSGNTATSASDFTVTTSAPTIIITQQPQSLNVCEGETASFTLTASGAANLSYQWQKFNGTIFSNTANGSGITGTTTSTLSINTSGNSGAGEYRCKVSGDLALDVFSESAELTVNPYPEAAITVDGTQLTASPGDNYQWYHNGEELSLATDQSLSFNSLEYGQFTVDVTVNGCTSSSDEFVYLITATESGDRGVNIYPNPFTDHLYVELPLTGDSEIKIFDALGRTVKKYSLNMNTTLQLDDLNTGTYTFIVQTGSKNFYYRLIKTQ